MYVKKRKLEKLASMAVYWRLNALFKPFIDTAI